MYLGNVGSILMGGASQFLRFHVHYGEVMWSNGD